jgi:hypothetical protein
MTTFDEDRNPYTGQDIPPPMEPPTDPWDVEFQHIVNAETPKPQRQQTMAEKLLDRADLANLPTPEPLIDDTIDRRTVAVLAGPYGTCKSFVAQAWAAHLATGKPWMARGVPETPSKVLYVAAEGAYGLNQRFLAWEQGYNRRQPIPAERLFFVPAPVNLTKAGEVAELCELAQGMDLVVIDTLARCLVGADENSAKDIGLAVDALYQLRDATGDGSVLGLHHTGKDRTTIRGSSALEAGVDTVYKTEGDVRNLRLYRTKRKDGPTDDSLQLQLNMVPGTDSAVLSRLAGELGHSPSSEALLQHMASHYSELGATKSDLVETSGMSKSAVYRAVNDLLKTGELITDGRAYGGRIHLGKS